MRLYSFLGKPNEFYTSKNMINFIKDIYDITSKLNINLVIKQKRKIADSFELEDPQYFSFIKKLSKNSDVHIIEDLEGESLRQIFQKTKLCISIPLHPLQFYLNNLITILYIMIQLVKLK